MNKIFISAIAASAVLFSSSAMAGTLQGEVRFGDVRNDRNTVDSTEYRVQWDDSLNSFLNYGLELEVRQGDNAGNVDSKMSAKLGPVLPTVVGFKPTAYAEVGRSFNRGDNYDFWGAGVNVSRNVIGAVSANVGYRHREGFGGASDKFVENRLNGGLSYNINDNNAVGVNYYRTTGTARYDQIGVGFSHSF